MKDNIIFAGCSFTWGQGLWSYMKTDEYVPTAHEWIFKEVPLPSGSIEFKDKHRFPGIVSRALNKTPIVKVANGGTDDESIHFMKHVFDKSREGYHSIFPQEVYEYNHVSNIVYQTTMSVRSSFKFSHRYGPEDFEFNDYLLYTSHDKTSFGELYQIFPIDDTDRVEIRPENDFTALYEWMYENDYEVDDVLKMKLSSISDKIESNLKFYESVGIDTSVLCWSDEYLEEFESREFMKDRLIPIIHENKEYKCIEHLFKDYPELQILKDPDVLHTANDDGHPSLKCHKILAESVLKKIK